MLHSVYLLRYHQSHIIKFVIFTCSKDTSKRHLLLASVESSIRLAFKDCLLSLTWYQKD